MLVVGEDPTVIERAEAILCKLKFAVSTTTDSDEARRIIPDLRPNVVVVSERHEEPLRTFTTAPVVRMPDTVETMIEDIRRALRVTPIPIR